MASDDAPPPGEEDRDEAARLLFAAECRFVAGAATIEALPAPAPGLQEVAFAGRSNVGKSSLINALTGRKTLAKVSNTPGRTQQINFFDLAGRLMLVDMPGYGYAEASKRAVADWTALIELYLKGRANLRRVLVLIDSRHGIKQSDRDVIELLDEAAVNYQIVLTKIDKLTVEALGAVARAIAAELARHTAAHPEILATSAQSGAGLREVKLALLALAAPPPMR